MTKSIFLLTCIFWLAISWGQENLETAVSDSTDSLNLTELPTLTECIDSAIVHSPMIKYYDALVDRAEFNLKAFRTMWLEQVTVDFESKYGQYGTSQVLDQLSLGYGTAFRVRIPINLFVGRKSQLNVKHSEILSRERERDQMVQRLKIDVTKFYTDVTLAENTLFIRNESLQNAKVNYEYAQHEFNDSQIDITDYSRVYEYYVQCQVLYEEARNQYRLALLILEEMIGIRLTN